MGPLRLVLIGFLLFCAFSFIWKGLELFKTFDLEVCCLEYVFTLGFEPFRTLLHDVLGYGFFITFDFRVLGSGALEPLTLES